MRSDKNKKPDPNREIDEFLSRFDDASDTESEAFNNYLDESEQDKSSRHNFRWEEVQSIKSTGKNPNTSKKESAERKVTKDPAPSSIKVERNKSDSGAVHTYPVQDIDESSPDKPEPVEPNRADDDTDKTAKPGNNKSSKKKNRKTRAKSKKNDPITKQDAKEEPVEVAAAEIDLEMTRHLDEMFGISDADSPSDDNDNNNDKIIPDDDASDICDSDVKTDDSAEVAEEAAGVAAASFASKFKSFFSSVFNKKEEDPIELVKSDETSDFDEIVRELETNLAAEKSSEIVSDDTPSDDETSIDSASDETPLLVEPSGDPASDENPSDDTVYSADESAQSSDELSENDTPVTEEEESSAAAVAIAASPFDISNTPRAEKSALSTGYMQDPETGEYIKIDLGKRKRIEYRDVPETKKSKFALFGARKEKKKKEKKERRTLAQFLFCKKNKKYNPDEGPTYELNGKTIKNKKYKFSFLKLIRDFVVIGILMVMVAAGFGYKMIKEAPDFNYNDVYATVATASIVYDDQGKQIDNIYYTENRRIVKYEDMPENLINSVIAIEDKTFWKHHGFNWVRMIGAVWSSITGNGQISGTSTITQQLSRNVYLPDVKSERSLKRKFLEMYYAARLEHALSKEQIVEAYLNTIYLGYGCYGVNSAARTYFSKSVKDLDLVECAALAALPSQPHNFALLKNAADGGEVSEDSEVVAKSPQKIVTSDLSKDRRNLTLDLMLEQGLITEEAYKEAYDKPLNDFINPSIQSASSNNIYFHDYLIDTLVADLMEEKNISAEEAERLVYTGGLQIYSTLDTQAQNIVAEEFKDDSNFPGISAIWKQDYDDNILNNDGKIALYDYDDYFDEDGNFTFNGDEDEIVFNSDGSATIKTGHNVYIYETEVGGETDFSIEFKNYYVLNDDVLYSIQGGYINIPQQYKTSAGDGNVKISADFFNDDQFKNSFKKDGNNLIVSDVGYSLGQQVRQPQGAMVIVEVGTGQVKAMVGGRQFKGQRLLNRAVNSRQPGSSIKPLSVYGAALQKSYELEAEGKKWTYTDYNIDRQGIRGWGDYVTVHSSIEDERTKVNGKYWPKNATGGYSGTNNFRTAIQQSINTCAVKLEYQLTPEYGLAQLRKFGITTAIDAEQNDQVNDVNLAAMALGAMTEGVQPLEMALAYASFPAGGKLNSAICYTKVLDKNGDVLIEGKSEETEAMNEGVAWIMTDVLQSVVSRGIAYNADISEVQAGGKTGTTNDQYDIWFDGFTPSYAAALWIGTDQNIEMNSMSGVAAALWGTIMDQIPRAKEGEYKEQPDNVIYYYGDYYTDGTQVGLSSWSYAAEKRKARNAAYKKWISERENHKKKVIDVKGETKIVEKVEYKEISKEEALKRAASGDKNVGTKDGKYYLKVITKEKVVIEEKWHWEYESGWRDGDFSYKFDGQTYTDTP